MALTLFERCEQYTIDLMVHISLETRLINGIFDWKWGCTDNRPLINRPRRSCVYILKLRRKIGRSFEESLQGGELVKNLKIFWMNYWIGLSYNVKNYTATFNNNLLITSKIQRKLFIQDSITFSSKSAIKKVKTGQYFKHFLKTRWNANWLHHRSPKLKIWASASIGIVA